MDKHQFYKALVQLEVTNKVPTHADSFIELLQELISMCKEWDEEYFIDINDITISNILSGIEVRGIEVSDEIMGLIDVLNEADMDDAFGTEGWEHRVWG